jgi:hypothetical protein
MFLDNFGTHQRLVEELEQTPLTATATITGCYQENRYCFANFFDSQGQERFGKLDWRYYPEEVVSELILLQRGNLIEVRYAEQIYENNVILVNQYDSFLNDKGYFYDAIGIALACWIILMIHPEVMLFSLVDDMNVILQNKWEKVSKPQ